MKPHLLFCCLALTLAAAPQPHPTRPDRLVEIRDGFSIEYSAGQEAWVEMGFQRLRDDAAKAAQPAPPLPEPAVLPGSARDLRARRDALLSATARQIGLPAATPLQQRTFDTFLGYYELLDESMRSLAAAIRQKFVLRRLAIWERDDLIRRIRSGQVIDGITYDSQTDSGHFTFEVSLAGDSESNERVKAIHEAIEAQQLHHSFNYGDGKFSATVSPYARPKPRDAQKSALPAEKDPDSYPVLPVIYRGETAAASATEAFDASWIHTDAAIEVAQQKLLRYRDPTLVSIILHETAEVGLLDRIIGSRDRRWLCDGTANYVAWRVSRDQIDPEFANEVYNLDAQLRLHAGHQPKIDLVRWSAVEKQNAQERESALNRAHYAFATRAMFLLAAKHGDDALATIWQDVAKTDRKKVSAKTFAAVLRKRYGGDLRALVKAAEENPIPPAEAVDPQPAASVAQAK